jgi:hypothetical protein
MKAKSENMKENMKSENGNNGGVENENQWRRKRIEEYRRKRKYEISAKMAKTGSYHE